MQRRRGEWARRRSGSDPLVASGTTGPGGLDDGSTVGIADQALCASVRRLLALHGLGWVVGLLVPLVIVAGLADWLFHLDSVIRRGLPAALLGTLRLPALSAGASPAVRPVRRSRHRDADRGALAGPERPPGQHDPVPRRRRGGRPLRLVGHARGDGPAGARGDRARSTSAR